MEDNGAQKIIITPEPARPGAIGRLEHLDHRVFRFCYETTKNPVFDIAMPVLSNIANRGTLQGIISVILIVSGFCLEEYRLREAAFCVIAGTVLSGLVAETLIKSLWKRKRPFVKIEGVGRRVRDKRLLRRPSFPSGHAAGYMASAVALSAYFPAWTPLFVAVALLGGYSRIYNGVHFPSDVAAGVLAGAACGVAAVNIIPAIF